MSDENAADFSKGVHDYYARYADNADGKIKGLFTVNLAVAGLLLGSLPHDCPARVFTWIAVGLHAVAGCFLMNGFYPRLNSSRTGVIFWEDVRLRASSAAYANEVRVLTPEDVEQAYAENNYFVARVLHRKFWAIRLALWATVAALAFGVARIIAG